MNKIAVATLGLALFGLIGCDSDLLHQDRPGGSDYQGGSSGSSYGRDYDRGYGRDDDRDARGRDERWQDPTGRSYDDRYPSRRGY